MSTTASERQFILKGIWSVPRCDQLDCWISAASPFNTCKVCNGRSQPIMLEFRTQGYQGYAVKYSPFFDARIAVATAANFGLVGNGRLYILGLTAQGIVPEKVFDTQDALYDLSWSELHENHVVTANGDGSIKLFDIGLDKFPIKAWQEHKREVFAVHWNLVSKDTFCSSSWDGCIKIWNPNRSESMMTLPTHACTYSVSWSPHSPSIVSSVSSDSTFRLFDLRTPSSAANHLVTSIALHAPPRSQMGVPVPRASPPAEALTHDWNRYSDVTVACAGVDRAIRTFDVRQPAMGPTAELLGHGYAVRRLAWSPHAADVLLSASYDMSCRVWKTTTPVSGVGGLAPGPPTGQVGMMERHTEFACGVDWTLFGDPGWCASTGWDERVLVWDAKAVAPALR